MRFLIVLSVFLVTLVIVLERIAYETHENETTCFEAFIQCHGRKVSPEKLGFEESDARWDSALDELFPPADRLAVEVRREGRIYSASEFSELGSNPDSMWEVHRMQTGLCPELGGSFHARGATAWPSE